VCAIDGSLFSREKRASRRRKDKAKKARRPGLALLELSSHVSSKPVKNVKPSRGYGSVTSSPIARKKKRKLNCTEYLYCSSCRQDHQFAARFRYL
jgi:hypothetical protein